ncbi:ATPase, partial [Pseudomonas shirazensis]
MRFPPGEDRITRSTSLTTAHTAFDQAVERCAQEPIQVPGSIQPQGFMLVLDEQDLCVLQASENAERWLGAAAPELLGRTFAELISDSFDLRAQMQYLPVDEVFPFHIGDVELRQPSPDCSHMRVLVHRHDQVLITEFEPIRTASGPSGHGDY